MKVLAVDFGGSHATCGLVEDTHLLDHEEIRLENTASLLAVLPAVKDSLSRLLERRNLAARECVGIAMGLPSLVDARTTKVLSTRSKYTDAEDIDLPTWGREAFGIPVRIENDARMALLGESYAGAGAGFANIVMMTLGTGIGGTVMIEGELLRGKHSQAGCLGGHLMVLIGGRKCIVCGANGCAEAEASGWSLPLVAQSWPGISTSELAPLAATLNFQLLFEAVDRADRIAVEIRDRCLTVWGAAILSMVHAFDPELVLIGGGVVIRKDTLIPFLQQYLDEHSWTPWGKVQVKAAELRNNAALLGAIPLFKENF
jgi:glucokinase